MEGTYKPRPETGKLQSRQEKEAAERTRQRKLRTRRPILIGSVKEPDLARPRSKLLRRLNQALDHDRGRALFDLPLRSAESP